MSGVEDFMKNLLKKTIQAIDKEVSIKVLSLYHVHIAQAVKPHIDWRC